MPLPASGELALWIGLLTLAWWAGEWCGRTHRVPRIALYALIGLGFGLLTQALGHAARPQDALWWFARLGLALMLFSVGNRVHPRWFVRNRGLLATGLIDAVLCFAAGFSSTVLLGFPRPAAAIVGCLCVAASPVDVLRVVEERRAAGLMTERLLHLSVLSAMLAVVLLQGGLGIWIATSGAILGALETTVRLLFGSILMGAALGWGVPRLFGTLDTERNSSTVPTALSVVLQVVLADYLGLSAVISSIVAGVATRHAREALRLPCADFGTLGELGTVAVFALSASLLQFGYVGGSLMVGLMVVVARQFAKLLAAVSCAHWSGLPLRKAALSGLALSPLSAFAVFLLDGVRGADSTFAEAGFLALSGGLALLEVLGPWLTHQALRWSGEIDP